jgi:hypothetical protein
LALHLLFAPRPTWLPYLIIPMNSGIAFVSI